ncbi:redox-sensitive transcriptional activator SoxR [Kineococcus sp. T13]|uniref:redox-sensitive transcriptional activator SoxR n=1 Tax=Kineococcus vitellinus TaxID=2696565 RepID=UPI0014128F54|nr:redox-sensitive transcriptional activator SoxR [Kineococcus vitellinus]NAZ76544.1 redox-sensitive transcriptional activator SoxR [Kineococcus vitellinus]
MLTGVPDDLLSIGAVASRAGISVPAIRYYEERGLLTSVRDTGGRRRFPRSVLRRLAVVAAGQRIGLSLAEVADALSRLPSDRAPSASDWARVGEQWQLLLDARLRELEALRTALTGCIGCGCLSLQRCGLFNPGDEAAAEGTGSRWVRGARRAAARPGSPRGGS